MNTIKEYNVTELAIEARGLIKNFGNKRAVNGVDLIVPRGCVYGVLGPNGAGKTTTIRMLSTLLKPDGGIAKVLGYDLLTQADDVRSMVSLTGQFASLDENLSGLENLIMIARLMGYSRRDSKSRAFELLHAFGLEEAAKQQVKNYSGGMRRRIDIAASIVVTPALLFLDEPTTGLDPRSRNQVWSIIRALVAAGTTVLLTTQYLDEADQLADRIAVIDQGKVIAEGSTNELKASVGTGILHIRLADSADRPRAAELLENHLGVTVQLEKDPASLSASISDIGIVAKALAALDDEKINITSFSQGQPSLDEVFLTLTGRTAKEQTTTWEGDK